MNDVLTFGGAIGIMFGAILAFSRFLFSNLSKENKEYRDELKKDYNELQAKYDSLSNKMAELGQKQYLLQLENDKLHREVERLTEEVKNLTSINGELRVREKGLIEESGKLKQKLEEKDNIIKLLKDQVVQLGGANPKDVALAA